MTLLQGQLWCGTFVTLDTTGALAAATVGPVGAVYLDGVANAAAVTISGANPYKFSVTTPAATAGQTYSMYITATVGGIATAAVVAEDVADTKRISDGSTLAASQGAITFSQIKVNANTALEAAVDIYNATGEGVTIESAGVNGASIKGADDGLTITGAAGDGVIIDGQAGSGINVSGSAGGDIVGDTTGNLSGSVGSVTTKTGYVLAATGLDAITATDPGTVATTWPQMLVQVWRRWFKKTTMTATALKTYADAGVVVDTTQTISDDGVTQTQGAAT